MIAGTVLAFLAARAVINETQLSANDSRNYQAYQAAQAGIDAGLADFNNGTSLPETQTLTTTDDITSIIDAAETACAATSVTAPASAAITNNSFGLYYFANDAAAGDRCNANLATNGGTLTSIGWSDDCSAKRTISVCLGVLPIVDNGQGPKQPVVSASGVGFLGSGEVINRYSNITIWAGEEVNANSAAFKTWVRDSDLSKEDLSDAQLIDIDPGNTQENAQLISNNKAGLGVDVVTNDPSLANLVQGSNADPFWQTFFTGDSLADQWGSITGTDKAKFQSAPKPNTTVDGNTEIHAGTYIIHDPDEPLVVDLDGGTYGGTGKNESMILVVDGDLEIKGNVQFYGMIYVTGKLTINGGAGFTVYGSILSSGANDPTAGGGPNIVYRPLGGEGNPTAPGISGTGSIIPGSWQDW